MFEPLGAAVPHSRRGSKRLFWIIGVAVVVPIVMTAGIIGVVLGGLYFGSKSTEEYKCAINEVRKNERARQVLGEPITEGFFIMPNITIEGPVRTVNFQTSVKGSKGDGTLTVSSYRDHFRSDFIMYLEKDGEYIELYKGIYPCGNV